LENMSRESKFRQNLKRITDVSHEYLHTYLIISLLIILKMRNDADKICRENQNAHFIFDNFLPTAVPFMRYAEK
jgi:hypothetical protein